MAQDRWQRWFAGTVMVPGTASVGAWLMSSSNSHAQLPPPKPKHEPHPVRILLGAGPPLGRVVCFTLNSLARRLIALSYKYSDS